MPVFAVTDASGSIVAGLRAEDNRGQGAVRVPEPLLVRAFSAGSVGVVSRDSGRGIRCPLEFPRPRFIGPCL